MKLVLITYLCIQGMKGSGNERFTHGLNKRISVHLKSTHVSSFTFTFYSVEGGPNPVQFVWFSSFYSQFRSFK